jgi:hypothetical protein
LQNIAEQSQKLVQIFLSEQPGFGQVGIGDASAFGGAFLDLMTKMIADPAAVARADRPVQRQPQGLAEDRRAHDVPAHGQ